MAPVFCLFLPPSANHTGTSTSARPAGGWRPWGLQITDQRYRTGHGSDSVTAVLTGYPPSPNPVGRYFEREGKPGGMYIRNTGVGTSQRSTETDGSTVASTVRLQAGAAGCLRGAVEEDRQTALGPREGQRQSPCESLRRQLRRTSCVPCAPPHLTHDRNTKARRGRNRHLAQ